MATKKQTTKKRKRRVSRFTTMVILLVAIVVLSVATLFMRSAFHASQAAPDTTPGETKNSVFSVREITVSGNTRYLPEAIVQVSGLYEGESIWSVDKVAAQEAVMAAFPYVESAKVTNTAYNKLNIAVTETKEIGVMYGGGSWLAVGANGKVLDVRPLESDRPLRTLYFKGAAVGSGAVGEQAMADRDFAIVTELLAAFDRYDLDGVCEIDLTNKSDIRLNWNNRMIIRLGNDTNLTHEVGVVVSAMPGVERQYGTNAAGQLDVSAFSDADAEERAVFTPQELLTTTAPETTTQAETELTAAKEPEE